jgi:putative Ca2+/H+ antiporter (TMEM165/GDT1 family)
MSLQLLTWISTYLIVILCELGDKTQVAVLLLTSNNPRRRWIIFGASSLALVLCVTLEVTIGMTLARYIGPALINRFAGAIFLLLGILIISKNRRKAPISDPPEEYINKKSALSPVEVEAET